MANATIQFTRTDDYILAPTDQLQLNLITLPPAGATLDVAVYAAPLGQDSGFRQIGRASIDSLANRAAATRYVLPLSTGTGYVFRLDGEARIMLPGQHSITVGLTLTDAAGRLIHDFGSQTAAVTHALLDGLFFVKMAG